MITLHGFSASNYYNAAKHVLLYKGIPYEEHLVYSGDELLDVSPVGKVPAITTDQGRHLSEAFVICDYLEETYPDTPLYPADAGERASVRQIMKVSELYLELPSRRLLAYAFSGAGAPDAVKDDVRHVTRRGIGAMQRLCQFSPWIAGETMTMADIYVFYVCAMVKSVGSAQLEWDIIAEIPGMKDWLKRMRDSDISKQVEQERKANEPGFAAYISQYMASRQPKPN